MFEDINTIIAFIVVAAAVIAQAIIFVAWSYTVVPPYQAHVVVSRGKGRKVYCARTGFISAYWRLPIVQRRAIIILENVQMSVNEIPLRDKSMAKFIGDVVAWLNVEDPLLASERIGRVANQSEITSDVSNIIRAVTRNMSMYWTIIDIMTKRKDFSTDVETNVNKELKEWGMKLVELEVIHFSDESPYTVIKDLEARQSTVINAETRKLVAGQLKEASIVESNAQKDTELTVAANEELFRKRQIERDETIGKRDQEKEKNIAEQTQLANEKKIEAVRTMTVGQADIQKEALIRKSEGDAGVKERIGEADAKVTRVTGEALGSAIQSRGFAEAASTDKRADALKKYNDAGVLLEIINASKDVQISQADNWGKAMAQAKIQVYSGGEGGSFFGMPLSAKGGFSLGAFAEIAKEHGIDLQKMGEAIGSKTIPIVDSTKIAKGATKPKEEKGE